MSPYRNQSYINPDEELAGEIGDLSEFDPEDLTDEVATSISDRPPLDDISGAQQPGENIPSAVSNAISSRMGSPNSSQNTDVLGAFDKSQAGLRDLQNAGRQSNAQNSVFQAISNLAKGAQAPSDQAPLFQGLQAQNNQIVKDRSDADTKRTSVLQAIAGRDAKLANAKAIHGLASQRLNDRNQTKLDKESTDRFDKLNRGLTSEMANSRSVLGIAAKNKQSIENVEALLNGQADLNDLDATQAYEVAKVLDRVLSQGSPTISGTEHLSRETAKSWLSKKIEQITSTRRGAGLGSFLESNKHTFEREKEIANKQIREANKKFLASYKDLEKRDPAKWADIMHEHGLDVPDAPAQTTPKAKPAPHGDPVEQNGKMYKWDGEKYEEVKG